MGVYACSYLLHILVPQVWHVSFPEQQAYAADVAALAAQSAAMRYTPEPSLFFSLFPFHLLIDQDMRLVQVCGGVSRVC